MRAGLRRQQTNTSCNCLLLMNTKIGMVGWPVRKYSQTVETNRFPIILKCVHNWKFKFTCLKHKKREPNCFRSFLNAISNSWFSSKSCIFLKFQVFMLKINHVPIVLRHQKLCWLKRARFAFHLSPIFEEFRWITMKIQLPEVMYTFQEYPGSVGLSSSNPGFPVLWKDHRFICSDSFVNWYT